MVQGTVSSAGLPAPWQEVHAEGLTYYWNTETNVTQYERPVAGQASKPAIDYSYLGGATEGGALGNNEAGGEEEYNAPPPDAYKRGGGLGVSLGHFPRACVGRVSHRPRTGRVRRLGVRRRGESRAFPPSDAVSSRVVRLRCRIRAFDQPVHIHAPSQLDHLLHR